MSEDISDYELRCAHRRRFDRLLREAMADTDPALALDTLRDAMKNGRGMVRIAAAQTMLKLIIPSEDESVRDQLEEMARMANEAQRMMLNAAKPTLLIGGDANGDIGTDQGTDRTDDGDTEDNQGDDPQPGEPPDPA
jgi:hypothetical protein